MRRCSPPAEAESPTTPPRVGHPLAATTPRNGAAPRPTSRAPPAASLRGGRRSASPPPVGCEPTPHGRWPVWRRRRRSTPYTTVVPPDTWEAGPSQRTPAAPTRAHAVVGRVSRIRGTLAGGGVWRPAVAVARWEKDRVWLGEGGGRGAAGGRRPARPTRGCRGGRPRRGRVCWERSGCAGCRGDGTAGGSSWAAAGGARTRRLCASRRTAGRRRRQAAAPAAPPQFPRAGPAGARQRAVATAREAVSWDLHWLPSKNLVTVAMSCWRQREWSTWDRTR